MVNEKQGAAEWLRGIIGRYEDDDKQNCSAIAKAFGVDCFRENTCRGCIAKMMKAVADRIDAERALPEGVEWPRFEDGELVRIGDDVEHEGETMRVYLATLDSDGWALWCSREGIDGRLSGSYGERVKRPAPKVLDADGVPIEVGDTVWATYDGRRHIVKAVCSDGSLHPEMLTNDGCMVEYEGGLWDFAKKVTHERHDSWEKLEEDADKCVCEYAGAQKSIVDDDKYSCINCPYDEPGSHTDKGCQERMRLDLVRRAKKLAGIEDGGSK